MLNIFRRNKKEISIEPKRKFVLGERVKHKLGGPDGIIDETYEWFKWRKSHRYRIRYLISYEQHLPKRNINIALVFGWYSADEFELVSIDKKESR